MYDFDFILDWLILHFTRFIYIVKVFIDKKSERSLKEKKNS